MAAPNPIMSVVKAAFEAGKYIVKMMKAPAKAFMKHKAKGEVKKKGLSKFTKNLANKVGARDGEEPKLLDIGKQKLKKNITKFNEDWQDGTTQKKILEKINNKVHERLSKAFNVDSKKLTEEHKLINDMRASGIPLSDILKLKQEGKLSKDELINYRKEFRSRLKSLNKNRRVRENELNQIHDAFYKELEENRKLGKDSNTLQFEDLKLDEESREEKNENKKYINDVDSTKKKYDNLIERETNKKKIKELENKKSKELKELEIKHNSTLDDIRSTLTAKKTNNLLNESLKNTTENLLEALASNQNLSEEDIKSLGFALLKSNNKISDSLESSIGDAFNENADFVNENNSLFSNRIDGLKDQLINLRKEDLERDGKGLDKITESINSAIKVSYDVLNKDALMQRESTNSIMKFIEGIEFKDEEEKKRLKAKELAKLKEDSEANEAARLADLGIMNVLKSQNTLFDLVTTNIKSPKEIGNIFTDAGKAAVESIGEDIGFWGTGIALVLKKIPETIQMGFEKMMGFIFKPFDMLISKFAEPIGKGLTTAFGWAEPYQTPGWMETLLDIPVVKWLVKPFDYVMERITNIPYNMKSFGEQLLETGESNIGEGLAHYASQPFVDMTGGLSKLVLKVLGLPDDMLDDRARDLNPSKQGYITKSSAAYVDKIQSHDSAEKISSSNIDATASLASISPILKGANEKIGKEENPKIDEINDELNKQKMLDHYNEEIISSNTQKSNSLVDTDSLESKSKAELSELANLNNYHEILTEDQSKSIDRETNEIIKQKMLDHYNEEIIKNNKAILKEIREAKKQARKDKKKEIKSSRIKTDEDSIVDELSAELIRSDNDQLDLESEALNQIEIDQRSKETIKDTEINPKENTKKEPDVIVQPTAYTYERVVHEYDAEPVFPTGNGF